MVVCVCVDGGGSVGDIFLISGGGGLDDDSVECPGLYMWVRKTKEKNL